MKLYPFPADSIMKRMKEVLGAGNPQVEPILDYLLDDSGKMLRPRLLYLAASSYPHDPLVVRDMCAVIELIHLASLVHDDVIDQASIRRGKESVNSRYSNKISVLTGDLLFATAFNLINYHSLPQVMEQVTRTIQLMCQGEIKQLSLAFDLDISEQEYYEKSYRKTACLFACSCRVGAYSCNMPEKHAALLEDYGLYLGYAYQVIDDILDLIADSHSLGKPAGSDLREGNITLPLIYALQDGKYGKRLKKMLAGEPELISTQEIKDILFACEAIEYALSVSQRFLRKALNSLESFPANPAVEEMKNMAVFIMEGYYSRLSYHGKEELVKVVN